MVEYIGGNADDPFGFESPDFTPTTLGVNSGAMNFDPASDMWGYDDPGYDETIPFGPDLGIKPGATIVPHERLHGQDRTREEAKYGPISLADYRAYRDIVRPVSRDIHPTVEEYVEQN